MATELRKGHTIDNVALALRVLAYFSGNVSRAAEALTAEGHPISPRTLARWRDSHFELYWDIRRELEADAADRKIIRSLEIISAWLDVRGPRVDAAVAKLRDSD
jgi:hypothetical protein